MRFPANRSLGAAIAALVLSTLFIPICNADIGKEPAELIESVADDLARRINAEKDSLEANESELVALINEDLRPHFDFEIAARGILGRSWKEASETERTEFADAFYDFLVRSYGDLLLDFKADTIKVMHDDSDVVGRRAKVATEMTMTNGDRVAVSYQLRLTADGWKIWDVIAEGVSYVKTYRSDFATTLSQAGVPGLIDRLRNSTAEI